ncbi:hypothetical protein SKAU_G00190390 [Synaphobranchus kaupii]|uniref:Uncharacterized protein n=1 Tax=Synaphobranchus kaupii TaxID=118154 RepID=A0A9Q1IXC6_SYNKA|nr:hypothetical protein SKAU_G00190390 [Synaphobranchus kaupii]
MASLKHSFKCFLGVTFVTFQLLFFSFLSLAAGRFIPGLCFFFQRGGAGEGSSEKELQKILKKSLVKEFEHLSVVTTKYGDFLKQEDVWLLNGEKRRSRAARPDQLDFPRVTPPEYGITSPSLDLAVSVAPPATACQ